MRLIRTTSTSLSCQCRAEAANKHADVGPALTPEQFATEFNAGKIYIYIYTEKFDDSAFYRACVANYAEKAGKLTTKERSDSESASDEIICRVLAETSILFTTCNDAGGKLLEDGASFKPIVVFCGEASQVSLASLCVPLTSFADWEGLFLFGDTCQLEPTVLKAITPYAPRPEGLPAASPGHAVSHEPGDLGVPQRPSLQWALEKSSIGFRGQC